MRSALAALVAVGVLAITPAAHADFPEQPGDSGATACSKLAASVNPGLSTAFGSAAVGDSLTPPKTEARILELYVDACLGGV